MKTLLLPVEHFSRAKRKMTALLSESERTGLARAMFLDVVTAILGTRTLDRVVVLTKSTEAAELAISSGFETWTEKTLNHALERLAQSGTVIVIPADLPTLRSAEIDIVLNECGSILGLIPSQDGTRANGAIMHPQMKIEMLTGPASLQRQLNLCRIAGIPCRVLNVAGIAFDLDTPEDLFAFLQTEPEPTHTWQYIQTQRIPLSLLP